MSLPLSISLAVSALLVGGINSYIGFCTLGMIASVVVNSVSAGLLTIVDADTSLSHWIAYQILLGIGCGLGWQSLFTALSNEKDVAVVLVFIGFLILVGAQLS